jgi:hypothetical protein
MRFHHHLLSLASLLAACPAQAATQSGPVISNRPAGSVILRPEPFDVTIKSLKVIRQFPIADIQKQLVMTGSARLNFKPMLTNPRALFNIAAQLRKLPKSVSDIADETVVKEVPLGIVVSSTMRYRLKTGACADGARRTMLAKTGISCATQVNDSSLAAAFASPNDAHYVADPAKRATALAEAKSKRAAGATQIAADVAKFRGYLSNPTMQAQFDAEHGVGESSRLTALSDQQLQDELVNTAETLIREAIFIPNADSAGSMFLRKGPQGKAPAAEQSSPDVDVATPITPHTFLTGFTEGRNYEWRQRFEKEIGWCKVTAILIMLRPMLASIMA